MIKLVAMTNATTNTSVSTPEDTTATTQAELIQELGSTQQEFLRALTNSNFYAETAMAGVAIAIALLTGWLFKRLLIRSLAGRLLKLTAEEIGKPLKLLGPVLVILALNIARPIAEKHTGNSLVTQGLIELSMALVMVQAIFLLVRTQAVAWLASTVIVIMSSLEVAGLLQPIAAYLDSLALVAGKVRLSALGIIHGFVILVVVLWSAGSLSRMAETHIHRVQSLSYNARELLVKLLKLLIYIAAFLITLNAMGIDLTVLAVFGGALGVGIGLGLQKITSNFVSGVTLLLENSIKIGDLIEIGGLTGTVRQLNARYAMIETADGRELLVPNEQLITSQVSNWTYSNERGRAEIHVTIPHDSDAELARKLMLECACAHPRCMSKPSPECFLQEFTPHGLTLVLHFWVADVKAGKLGPQSDVMFAILGKFREHNIQFAAPPK